jgi:hypothetical protein
MSDHSGSSQFSSFHFTDQSSTILNDRSVYLNSHARTSNYPLSDDDRRGNWISSKHNVCHNTKYHPLTNYYTIAWIKDQNRFNKSDKYNTYNLSLLTRKIDGPYTGLTQDTMDVHSSSNPFSLLPPLFHINDEIERTDQQTESTELNISTECLPCRSDLGKAGTKNRP